MNRIDVVLVIIVMLFALRGVWRGFSREFFGFIGLIGGLAVAAAGYAAATAYLPAAIPTRVRPVVAFAGVFFAINFGAGLAGAILHRIFGIFFLSPINRIAGGLFGALKGAAIATIVLLLVRAYVASPGLLAEIDDSQLAAPLLGLAGEVRESGAFRHERSLPELSELPFPGRGD